MSSAVDACFPWAFPRRIDVAQVQTWRAPLGNREDEESWLVVQRASGDGASVSPPLLPRAGRQRHGGFPRSGVLFFAVGVLRRDVFVGVVVRGGVLHPWCHSTLRTVLISFVGVQTAGYQHPSQCGLPARLHLPFS